MIQELLGGVLEERKMSMPIPGNLLLDSSTTSSPATSVSSQSSVSPSLTSPGAGEHQQQQNLRCPRCDSSNTKFCYYNNYNLTQPRHFCKTCRRYWTKGGALRNVPIGGGCRKTKAVPSIVSAGAVGKCSPAKAKTPSAADLLLSRSGLVAGLDRDLVTSPILWPSPHNTSHLMALLRSASVQNPNPNSCSGFNLNSARIKEDGSMLGEHMARESTTGLSSGHGLSLDPSVQLPFGTSLWRNHSNHYSYNQHSRPQAQSMQQQHSNMLTGQDMLPSSGIQDLHYQRLKSSGNYHNEQLQTMGSNSLSESSCSSVVTTVAPSICTDNVMGPNPLPAADFSCWNPNQALPWTDLPTANGAFP